jgi:hypothetical protein
MGRRSFALRDMAADVKAATLGRAAKLARAIDHMPPAGAEVRLQQLQLLMQYRGMRSAPSELPGLADVRFDIFTPDGEDGALLYIFGLIGFSSRRCVDIGGAGVTASNTANLIVNHDFQGLVLDGNEHGLARTARAYRRFNTAHAPQCVPAWITRDNVNDLLAEHGVVGEIDLLSLDMDGVDWWILDALEVVDPRVIVVEYQDILGPERPWTVPYRPDFNFREYPVNDGGAYDYCGAGLSSFVHVLKPRGYRLVGCNRAGYNAFFVRSDEAGDMLPEVGVESCFVSPWNRYGMEHRFPRVADMDWTDVTEVLTARVR